MATANQFSLLAQGSSPQELEQQQQRKKHPGPKGAPRPMATNKLSKNLMGLKFMQRCAKQPVAKEEPVAAAPAVKQVHLCAASASDAFLIKSVESCFEAR